MSDELGILDLLTLRGFDSKCKSKLVRHQDKRYDVPTLIREGWIDLYQSLQARSIFGDCDYIVTFTGDGGTRAKLLGVYRVLEERPIIPSDGPLDCPYDAWRTTSKFFYCLEPQPQYYNLVGRVVIEWGAGALAWHQHMTNKAVIEILPTGRAMQPFSDYLDFTISHAELRDLISNPAAHRDWESSLSAVAGVYLILAETTGKLYVGSAYGLSGIWGRWQQYAANGHGNNKVLKHIVNTDAAYPESFRYSLLQVLPKSSKDSEVIRWESQYKVKLGSRATGLNAN
ncbi:MAG: GIY-YIG nuclease family protein [Planctomycetales bacterium]|nr:GIY-YIG nuclease family protein [Planctomycetales bacterium]